MEITINFTEGDTPKIQPGDMEYYLVRAYSSHSESVHTFAAYYLNQYPLHYEWGCKDCEDRGEENCPMANGDGCPTTGWFEEKLNGEDEVFYRLSTDVVAFAKMPAPEPQNQKA